MPKNHINYGEYTKMMQNILVPVDGSEDANKAVEFALDMAKQNHASIHIPSCV